MDHCIGRFAEEKRFLTVWICTHLEGVFRIIATDTINPVNREIL
jgi:hypothetical protein